MKITIRTLSLVPAIAVCCLLIACGGGSDSTDPLVTVESPQSGALFRAGDMVMVSVSTSDFVLEPPVNVDPATSISSMGSLVRETGEAHHDDGAMDSSGHSHDDSGTEPHSHSDEEFNPFARAGHLHIYLDGGTGSDPHVTTWSYDTPVELPADLTPGMHSLRIEARDSNHTRVGEDHDSFLLFEVE